jgi:PAS domain S-box-containing protein
VRKAGLTYAAALGILVAAVLLRWLLDPIMGDALPLVTLFGAVAAAVWLGGYRPALLVALLGYAACLYLFIEPRGQLWFGKAGDVVGLAAYLFTCSLIIAIGEGTRIAQARASEQRETLRVTLRSIGDAVITTDTQGRVTYLNTVAESLTGWTQQDAIGQPLDAVFRIVNEDSRKPVESPATQALRKGIVVGLANHTILIRRDGTACPIDDSAAPIRDEEGRVSGCVLIFRDVTHQRRLLRDKAGQLTNARLLASIIESSDDAIVSKSLDGIIQTWNAGAERLFGYSAGQAVGRHVSLIIPPDRVAEEDRIIASLKAGQRIEHFETERMRAGGERIQVSLTISPIKDEDGTVIGASKIARDITDRQRAEADLRRLANDLSEADRRKNEFLAMLAHELRNPLAPISNAARALRMGSGDREAVESASEMLERQVGHMARLVDDLLDMSRITRGKIELRPERVELAPIVHQSVEASRPLYRSLNHELVVTLPPQPVYLDGDPTRLAQVIGNLLNNAAKFTDKGGQVGLTVEREANLAVIRVKDNGIGIAREHLPRIFEMFAQLDTSLERSRDGLGIGLTLVRTLVEMHGGTIDVHSDGPGRGSEFVVRLPVLIEAADEPSRPVARARAAPVARRRLLIVDDNEDGTESLAMLLEFHGHETHKAYDGVEAIAAAERLRPDAVLLDIGLPGLNGYEACRRIREQSWGKEIFLVALTGWGTDEDRQHSREAGFDTHMVKPVDYDALLDLLASLPARAHQV